MTDQTQQTPESNSSEEITALKAQADLMGIQYSPNIGVDKLRERIAQHLKDEQTTQPVNSPVVVTPATATDSRLEATKLVRVIITPMDQTKKDYNGEIFTVSNDQIPTIKRYVPFGAETHVESILLDVIKDKQCLQLVADSNAKIKGLKKKKIIKAYAVQLLDPLTPEQLEELRKSQVARQSIE